MRANIGFRISSRCVHLCFKPIQSSKLHLPQAIKTKFVDHDDAEWRHAKLNGWHPLVVSVPEGGHKAFYGDTRKKVTKFRPKGGKSERIQRRRGRERIESAARPVLGIWRGEKNRPGRLTKEALIAAGSRERTSRLKSSLFFSFSFCLLIRLFSLSPPSLFFSFCLYISQILSFVAGAASSMSFSRTLWNRLSGSNLAPGQADPINSVERDRVGGWPATCSHIYAPRTTKFASARTISPFHALDPFRPGFPRVADRRPQLPGYSRVHAKGQLVVQRELGGSWNVTLVDGIPVHF